MRLRTRPKPRALRPRADELEPRCVPSAATAGVTFHYDSGRDGWLSGLIGDPTATPWAQYAKVNLGTVVRGAPVTLPGWTLPNNGGTHTLVFAVGSDNDVYAFEEDQLLAGSLTPLWQQYLGPPRQVPAGNIPPPVGVMSTPVIDPTTGHLYVLAAEDNGSGVGVYHAYSIDVNTGAILAQATLSDPGASGRPTFNGNDQDQRGALNLVNGWIYANFAAYQDEATNPDYHGWVVGFNASNLANQVYFSTTTSTTSANATGYLLGGAVWGPGGVAADAGGTLYLATGNAGFSDSTSNSSPYNPSTATYYNQFATGGAHAGQHPGDIGDHFEDVVALAVGGNGSLSVKDWYAPTNQETLNDEDLDLGGSSVLILPAIGGRDMAVVTGKDGNVYLLDRDHLGHFGGELWRSPTAVFTAGADYPGGSKCAPAFFQSSSGTDYVYVVGDTSPGLVAYQVVVPPTGNPYLQQVWTANASIGMSPGSALAATTAGGQDLVWTAEASGSNGGNGQADGVLLAYNAETGAPVFSADLGVGTPHFPALMATTQSVFVATSTGFVAYARVDRTPPTSSASVSGSVGNAGWFTGPVTVTLSATDPDNASSTLTTTYSIDGGASQTYTGPFTISTNGTHQVTYYSTDPAGNVEATKTQTVLIDQTPPTSSASLSGPVGSNGWFTGPVTVTLSATDNSGGSGVATTQYSLDGGAHWTTGTSLVLSTDGIYSVLYRSTDVAGNVEAAHTQAVDIDQTPPKITESAAVNSQNKKTATVTVSGTMTDNLSGIDPTQTTYTVLDANGNVVASGKITLGPNGTYSFTVNLQRSGSSQKYTIKVSARDKAGNLGTVSTVVTIPGKGNQPQGHGNNGNGNNGIGDNRS